eukprot:2913825-Amphidinium_carterae.1
MYQADRCRKALAKYAEKGHLEAAAAIHGLDSAINIAESATKLHTGGISMLTSKQRGDALNVIAS